MFSKNKNPSPSNERLRDATAPSIISTTLTIKGTLNSEGDVQVDGSIDGDMFAKSVTIGERAQVHGDIHADEIYIRGTVTGTIHGKNVHLHKTARVNGDIINETLEIEQGAFLDGHCKRPDSNALSGPNSSPAPALAATAPNSSPAPEAKRINLVTENDSTPSSVVVKTTARK